MSSDPSEGWHSVVLPTAEVLPQRPIRPDIGVDDLEGVITRGFLAPHADSPEPLPEGHAVLEVSSET